MKKKILKHITLVKNKIQRSIILQNPKYKRYVAFSKFGILGGLGNQLFQYAALTSYSLKFNLPVIIPRNSYFRLTDFALTCKYGDSNSIKLTADNTYKQEVFEYNKSFFNYYLRLDVEGYFQSEKYFIEFVKVIRSEFKIKDEKKIQFADNFINDVKEKFNNKDIVAVHVRRGDYLPSEEFPDRHFKHSLLKKDYFQSAMNEFSDSVFIFFSDNPEDVKWCKDNFDGDNKIFIHYDDLADFLIMQKCNHNIISNSSFSWWAAWLNNNPQKRIISPKVENWFGPYYAHYNMNDLIPDSWEQI